MDHSESRGGLVEKWTLEVKNYRNHTTSTSGMQPRSKTEIGNYVQSKYLRQQVYLIAKAAVKVDYLERRFYRGIYTLWLLWLTALNHALRGKLDKKKGTLEKGMYKRSNTSEQKDDIEKTMESASAPKSISWIPPGTNITVSFS
jgi:hypothetical protein